MSDLIKKDITCESWREYDWYYEGGRRVYTIDLPVTLYFRSGGLTHRVVDMKGVVHCVPAPGIYGCVLRWKSKDSSKPVAF